MILLYQGMKAAAYCVFSQFRNCLDHVSTITNLIDYLNADIRRLPLSLIVIKLTTV